MSLAEDRPEDRLEQPGSTMWERNAGHIARRGREVRIWIKGVPEPRVGFLAGLDEEYVQLCLTEGQTLSNIRRDSIVSMDETGVTLGSMIQGGGDPEAIRRIQEKVSSFQKRAAYLYGRGRASQTAAFPLA